MESTEKLTSTLKSLKDEQQEIREEVKALLVTHDPEAETRDTDYVFMRFVMDYLPTGVVGLLFAVIFAAAMSSSSSELNALGSTTTVDLYKRSIRKEASDNHYVMSSKLFTAFWGFGAILFATYASLFENLIQAVNLLGSLFYGTILGIFVVGFFIKWIKGNAVFISALENIGTDVLKQKLSDEYDAWYARFYDPITKEYIEKEETLWDDESYDPEEFIIDEQ